MNFPKEKHYTNLFIYQSPHLLLGQKKRGWGAGRWNGFGGKRKNAENIVDTAKRELWEEAGIEVPALHKKGKVTFRFENFDTDIIAHIFLADDFSGNPVETEEMRPQWFHVDDVPYNEMWEADRYWLPRLLQGEEFSGVFYYTKDNQLGSYQFH